MDKVLTREGSDIRVVTNFSYKYVSIEQNNDIVVMNIKDIDELIEILKTFKV